MTSSNPYLIPSINIPPSFVPKTPVDYQLLSLIHQFQAGKLSLFDIYLLNGFLNLPFIPIQVKLNLYHFFSSLPFIQAIHLPLWGFAILGLVIPGFTILIPILLILFIVILAKKGPGVIAFVLGKFDRVVEEKAFLELTFPSNIGKSAYATEQLYKLLNTRAKKQGWFKGLIHHKKVYSLEIVSNKDSGIVFMLVVPKKEAELLHHTLISFLPGLKVKEVEDYLTGLDGQIEESAWGVAQLKLGADFVLPLEDQKVLEEHDPISFLLGTMTNLDPGELIAFQIVTTPIIHSVQSGIESRLRKIRLAIARGEPLTPLLQPSALETLTSFFPVKILVFLFKAMFLLLKFIAFVVVSAIVEFIHNDSKGITFFGGPKVNIHMTSDPFEKELHEIVRGKVSQHLFETSIRILISCENEMEFESRADSITSSLGQFTTSNQSLISASSMLPSSFVQNKRLANFKSRSLSGGFGESQNPILSASEMADLYHFPNTDLNKVEGLVKHKSKDLPAPLSMTKSDAQFDVVIGLNEYGGKEVPIGLTLDQRERHSYVIGKTGMGKTEMLKSMIYQDMVNGKGMAVLDPHGDLFYELLRLIPKNRRKDVIVFNPADKEWPVGLNILSSGISFEDLEDGQDKIVSTTLAIFQKITDEKYWGPRLEHILRNTTQTSLFTPSPSFWVIQKLLTSSKSYQKEVAGMLKDPILKQFWESEFSLFGKMQQSDAISPITNRIGKFITSKMSRNILLQPKSTFNIQEVMDGGKILLVNLSKGELGEDQSHFFGSLIISLIQLAAYERIHIPEGKRRNFFLYVDEFQNFATQIFEELSSEGRKWHVPLIPSHQNIAQIKDPNLLKIVAGNADTFIALKAGPDDEKFILPFMEPEVEKGEIINLSPHHFFMKTTTDNQEDAFSGVTKLLDIKGSDEVAKEVIEYSRKQYATPRIEVEKYLEKLFAQKASESKTKGTTEEEKTAQPEKTVPSSPTIIMPRRSRKR